MSSGQPVKERELRNALVAYLADRDIGVPSLVTEIQEARLEMYGNTSTVKLVAKDTIRRLLNPKDNNTKSLGRRRFEVIFNFMVFRGYLSGNGLTFSKHLQDPFFEQLRIFYGVSDIRLEHTKKSLRGTYQFYANSEDLSSGYRRYVVRGALRFGVDEKTGALTVEERQESKRMLPKPELWKGYFFVRKDMIVILLQNPTSVAKIYILNHFQIDTDTGQVLLLRGRMMKIGTNRSVFSSKIYVEQEDDAFHLCDVLPPTKVPQEILDVILEPNDDESFRPSRRKTAEREQG